MLVKLILAIFALIVMLGTRSYADDQVYGSSGSSIYSSSSSSSIPSDYEKSIVQPLNDAHAAAAEADRKNAETKEQIDTMFSDDADIKK